MMIFFIGLFVGWMLRGLLHVVQVNRALNEVTKASKKKEETITINVHIEKHKGVFYLYDAKSGAFITQGSTREEINNNLIERYGRNNESQIAFNATSKNIEEVGFK